MKTIYQEVRSLVHEPRRSSSTMPTSELREPALSTPNIVEVKRVVRQDEIIVIGHCEKGGARGCMRTLYRLHFKGIETSAFLDFGTNLLQTSLYQEFRNLQPHGVDVFLNNGAEVRER